MSEQTETSPRQVGDRDKDSDKDLASTRRARPRAIDNDPGTASSRQRQAEQESALQQWETKGGAEEDVDTGRAPDSVQQDTPLNSGRAKKEQEANEEGGNAAQAHANTPYHIAPRLRPVASTTVLRQHIEPNGQILQISRAPLCHHVNHARQTPERQRARDQEATTP